jgi:hypothetical protein
MNQIPTLLLGARAHVGSLKYRQQQEIKHNKINNILSPPLSPTPKELSPRGY